MFFSTEILTSKNSGFSTAWLMATLGSKPFSNKVIKSEILATPVSKVCSMIEEPPGPLALRLSSQLLYGVSLIYQQQITYLLTDVTAIKTRLMHDNIFKANAFMAIDLPTRGKVRNELPNDPAFSLDFFLLPPLPPTIGEKGDVSDLSSFARHQGTQMVNASLADITLSNESVGTFSEARDFMSALVHNDDMEMSNVDFGFGEDGELVEDVSSATVGDAGDTAVDYNYDLPEFGDENFELGIQRVSEQSYQFDSEGNLEVSLEELREAALAGRYDPNSRTLLPLTRPTAGAATGTSGETRPAAKRPCGYDSSINIAIEDLRDFRDNYTDNMAAIKQRRVSRNQKKPAAYSFDEYAKLALGAPFANIFKQNISLTSTIGPYGADRRIRELSPDEIEFGREGEGQLSDRRYSSSPASIPLSERMRGSSSPNVRSSRFLPSDLGDIPELSSHSFGYDDVYNEDITEGDIGLGLPTEFENGDEGEDDSGDKPGRLPKRFDTTSKLMKYYRTAISKTTGPGGLVKDGDGYLAFNSVFSPQALNRAQAASAFSQILKLATLNRLELKQTMMSESKSSSRGRVWMRF